MVKVIFVTKTTVKIEGHCSQNYEVPSGMPQDSHLGPILFILLINDLVSVIRFCLLLVHVDYVKIFREIRSIRNCKELKSDLTEIINWAVINKLSLNVKKCNILSFYRKNDKITYDYKIDNQPLHRVEHIKALGVTFSRDLSFSRHLDKITSSPLSCLDLLSE